MMASALVGSQFVNDRLHEKSAFRTSGPKTFVTGDPTTVAQTVVADWEYTCFASRRDSSKPSIASFHFCLFPITWGICFSLES
jgi:hypothetical protein